MTRLKRIAVVSEAEPISPVIEVFGEGFQDPTRAGPGRDGSGPGVLYQYLEMDPPFKYI